MFLFRSRTGPWHNKSGSLLYTALCFFKVGNDNGQFFAGNYQRWVHFFFLHESKFFIYDISCVLDLIHMESSRCDGTDGYKKIIHCNRYHWLYHEIYITGYPFNLKGLWCFGGKYFCQQILWGKNISASDKGWKNILKVLNTSKTIFLIEKQYFDSETGDHSPPPPHPTPLS